MPGFGKKKKTAGAGAGATETSNLIGSNKAAAKKVVNETATFVNEAANEAAVRFHKAGRDGPIRAMALLGGLAMIVSNGIMIFGRFIKLDFTGSLLALYCTLFGFIVAVLEATAGPPNVQQAIRYYAKFLEYTWGRGMLYFFVGTLQASHWNVMDWAVGGWMMLTGLIAIMVGGSAGKKLQEIRSSIDSEATLKQQWEKTDANSDGSLDLAEFANFVKRSGVRMSQNEIAAAFLAIDKNHDEKITFEEFFYWWSGPNTDGGDGGGSGLVLI
mmetsp:Transcript_5074/g.7850  ORF Transcript_5074/g.7850 Transcript_5074/m.7850 type:complete len:271 (+) Transcript_5074:474-1286(+)|eukprot:CAMPEP_0118688180 /NCGR_PEP_ID=MMETSP0800-20121206/8780_1 /TAXON_ID=210618 ORGANISM="Striatella unipunctata, Strain CCMP2910" /NCGR_SAMPLE_ID=MMETSP0800 /ASSEMBLY_ACC=CAM_ASM_000638 /LENGTH=270 /DNA_ID=CAMNT_0006585417 /DNA_START=160 /DNA_END=972 /DNA_ORIENTATION=+